MEVLLAIACIGILLGGYLLMDRLDRFMSQGGFTKEPDIAAQKDILLFGEREALREIGPALGQAGISYDLTSEPGIHSQTVYRWIGAFSQDDADNLLICLSASRENPDLRTMARCNDAVYEPVFRKAGVTVILREDASPARILACLRERE